MKHKPAMYALLRLYGELRGKLITHRQQDEAIQADLKRVQAVLEMLEPGFDVSGIKPRLKNTPNPWFPKGHGFRIALNVLAKSEQPLTIGEIAARMFAAKAVPNPERKALRNLVPNSDVQAQGSPSRPSPP
jgi:hypothetical protein